MKIKNIVVSTLVAFVIVFGYEFVVHGILLKDMYVQTSELWRSESQMQSFFPWALLTQFAASLVFSIIYLQNHENKGWTEGLRFGSLLGLLLGVGFFGFYAYMPIPLTLALAWLFSSLLETILVGVALSLVNLEKN